MQTQDEHLDLFAQVRPRLIGLAYRMTGSLSDAEDIVQDAWLRWSSADRHGIRSVQSYLMQTVARLSIDFATSARARREVYVGPWLPEPILETAYVGARQTPEDAVELADDLSVALLLVLERLAPAERAAFLLHDVFDCGFAEIAAALGRSEQACRQLAARARRRVALGRPVSRPPNAQERCLIESFQQTLRDGDVGGLVKMLAEDAVLIADGGGKTYAALNPVTGRDRIVRFLLGLARKFGYPQEIGLHLINGAPGFVITEADGCLQTWSIDLNANHEVGRIYVTRNPDKLIRLRADLQSARHESASRP